MPLQIPLVQVDPVRDSVTTPVNLLVVTANIGIHSRGVEKLPVHLPQATAPVNQLIAFDRVDLGLPVHLNRNPP